MKRILIMLATLLALVASNASAQEARRFEEGPVSVVTSVKIMDGQYDNYVNYLAKSYKPVLEAQKAAGLIVRYAIYDATPRTPEDADMLLVVVDPNMASFDGLRDKTEPLAEKVTGMSTEKSRLASVERGKMREIMGSQMYRELILK